MRFLVASGARNPLFPNLILRGREPLLRQHLHQSGLQIENKKRKRRIVIRHRFIAGGHDQLVNRRQSAGTSILCMPGPSVSGTSNSATGAVLAKIRSEDCLNHPAISARSNVFELIRIEADKPNAPPLRAPDAKQPRRYNKRPAVRVQSQSRLVRFLLQGQRDYITNRPLLAVMRPGKGLLRRRLKRRKGLPIPGRRTNGALELLPDAGQIWSGHDQPAVGTPAAPFTLARMNFTMSSMAVPGWKIAATPRCFRASIS